jgi:hypothetical protein
MEEDLIIEIWDIFKEYVSDKNKEMAANHYVDYLLGKDIDTSTLKSLTGYDHHLDDAIELALGVEDQNSDEDDEDNWDYDEEDEDY